MALTKIISFQVNIKLYMHATHAMDKYDEHLSEKMALIQQFIRPENLDVKSNFQNETSLLVSV